VDLGLLLGGIAAGSGSEIAFHTGVITSWDETTGVNTVNVGGTDMANLSVLSPSTTIGLRAGMAVGVLRVRSKYFILGKIAAPGAGAALATREAYAPELVSTSNSSWVSLPGGPTVENVYIGESRTALVLLSATIFSENAYSMATISVTGASNIPAADMTTGIANAMFNEADPTSPGLRSGATVANTIVLNESHGLNTGFNTFTMQYTRRTRSGYTPTQDAQFENRRIVVMPL